MKTEKEIKQTIHANEKDIEIKLDIYIRAEGSYKEQNTFAKDIQRDLLDIVKRRFYEQNIKIS